MMEMREILELKKKYSALPDEEIIDMLLEGKDSYVEGAYELLLTEAKGRGIEGKLQKTEIAKEAFVPDEAGPEPETFVQIMIVNNEADLVFLKSILEREGILHFFQDLSLRGASLPVSLMVAESQVDKVRGICKDFKPGGSIVLW